MSIIKLNEAFATQALGIIKKLTVDYKGTQESILKCYNVNGFSITLEHL